MNLEDWGFDQCERDERQPLFVVPVAFIGDGYHLAFHGMSSIFWAENFAFIVLQGCFNVVVAIVVYKAIVQRQGSIQAYLAGYGLIGPMLVLFPLWLLKWLKLRNVTFMLTLCGNSPSLLFFRCIEAMHGTLPAYLAEGCTLKQFVVYFASTIPFVFDKTGKPLPFTSDDYWKKNNRFVQVYIQTSLVYSLLLSFGYQVFPRRPIRTVFDLVSPSLLANNFMMAVLTGLMIEGGCCGLGLMTSSITGIVTTDFGDNPLTKSSSPSDFWGRRWNRVNGPGLRRGIYMPARKALGLDALSASFLTFVASGLLHEYVLFLMTLREGNPNTPFGSNKQFQPTYGNHLFFFLYSGVLVLLDRILGKYFAQLPIPSALQSPLVVLTTLPVVHLFTDEYVASSFYSDASLGFFKILLLEPDQQI